MKPIKGTKGRKPKPHSLGGKRAAVAKSARRATPATRGQHSRTEIKRAATAKAAAEASAAARLGKIRKRPQRELAQRQGPMPRIDVELSDPQDLAIAPPVSREPGVDTSKWPVLAIVGRPNVGKSTLFNRLTSSRRSIVGDEPGITRDRIYGEIEWSGRHARVVDTGGILPDDPELIPSEIFRQARVALDEADSIVMVVDGRTPLAAPDYDLARLLLRGGKPLLLAVNKIDTEKMEEQTAEYRRLGIREILPISAEHGVGIGDLLDHVFATLPEVESEPAQAEPVEVEEDEKRHRTHGEFQQHETSIAIIGRPNVGKSTLLNVLTGSARAIVSPIPGTTRDAVDEVMEYDGGLLRFVDTAGIRRKGKTKMMAEKLSVVMARRHLEAADVALLVIDATEGVTSSDATIGGYAHESGRSVILVVNKWDLVTTGRTDGKPPADKEIFEEQLRKVLKYLAYAPVVFISAAEGKNIHTVLKLVKEVAAERRKRVSTGQMNRFLEKIDFQRATVPAANKMRIFYMTQAAVAPPTFILFTNRQVKLHFAFQRFLENQIRAAFGFRGSPIWFKVRARG
jgi:GTP-binding protein